jgi:enoyl-CoA hydratase
VELREVTFDKAAVAMLTINRPAALNALSRVVLEDIAQVLTEVRRDPTVRVLIVTGAGDRAFVAGADIAAMSEMAAGEGLEFSRMGHRVMQSLEDLPIPVIAAVNGFALGGGCETAMACTIRIAAEHAKFGQPEVKLGLIPGGGGTQRLPRLVGKGRALQLILSGEIIGAEEAHRIGLVNEVVPAAELIARAEAILKQIFANAPIAVTFSLEAVNRGMETSQAEGVAIEASLFGLCAGTEDKHEGTQAQADELLGPAVAAESLRPLSNRSLPHRFELPGQ